MKLLCASNNLAFIHALRIALDGEGIAHHFSDADQTLSSLAGPMTGSAARLYVVDDADWARAVALFKELDAPEASPPESAEAEGPAKPTSKWIVMMVSAVVFALLGVVVSN